MRISGKLNLFHQPERPEIIREPFLSCYFLLEPGPARGWHPHLSTEQTAKQEIILSCSNNVFISVNGKNPVIVMIVNNSKMHFQSIIQNRNSQGFFSKVVGKESSWQKIISVEISLKSVALLWPAVAECWSLSLKYVEFKLMQFLPKYRHLVPRTSFTRKSCCAKSRLDIINFIWKVNVGGTRW